jgi:hypothetical protein|tara:strand:- start:317 stop:478 length:162 start_codon:yes stop_codon:yes gene_type:complete
MAKKLWTIYCGRDDVEVSNLLKSMTKNQLIDEILGTYSKEDLIELGFLTKKEA